MKTVIVGGVAGGASAAARLRRLDESAQIVLLERGPHISFANCGLPYYIGGAIQRQSDLLLQTPVSFSRRFAVDVRVGSEVTAVDPAAKTVTVRELTSGNVYQESWDRLILSPGAAPLRPPLPGVDSPRVFTLRSVPDAVAIREFLQRALPRRAVVVGGGYIGVEMADNLLEAGLEVTIVELAPQLIAPLDEDMAADFHRSLRRNGIHVLLGKKVLAFEESKQGLAISVEGEPDLLEADLAVMAVGVRPDTGFLEGSSIETGKNGAILVDDRMQTSADGVYAVGDAVEVRDLVTGQPAYLPLAGPANKQGRIAADQICGIDHRYRGTQGSAVLKAGSLTVATTGLSERSALAKGLKVGKVHLYSSSHAGYYPGSAPLSIKVLYALEDGKILGAQVMGREGADKRCDVLAAAIRLGATANDLAELELCYAPPYSSAKDPVNMAGFVIQNLLEGLVQQFYCEDVPDLPRDGSATLLDVRTAEEHKRGNIPGFLNIPLDSLRGRLEELDAEKPVYLHCHSGLRSYLACRLLAGHGYTCYNLSGGYRLYQAVVEDREARGQG